MNRQPDETACGFYGKLPAKGDFVTRRLPPDFIVAWDAWLQDGLTVSRERFGENWLDAYLVAPVWRFVLPAGLLGSSVIAGVIMPSVDRVGRYFPLTIAVALTTKEGEISALCLASATENWFVAAEDLAMAALRDGLDFDLFDQEVAALELPDPPFLDEPMTGNGDVWMVALGPDGVIGPGLSRIADVAVDAALGSCSVWWTAGSDRVAPSLVVRRGMPGPEDYSALIDGVWLPEQQEELAPAQHSDIEEVP